MSKAKQDVSRETSKDPGRNHTTWPIENLKAYEKNARTHSPEQVNQICESIKEWGFTIPILVNPAGEIIAGHCRMQAATILGMKDVPVVVAEGWTEAQKRAYVIADNQLTLNGDWDRQTLFSELESLDTTGFDVKLTGLPSDMLNLIGKIEDFSPIGEDGQSRLDEKNPKTCPECGYEFSD